jgi:hypothetical protein
MALTDIVWAAGAYALEEARGNVGTLIDISAQASDLKDCEMARGNTGVLLDIAASDKKDNERPGAGGGGYSRGRVVNA